MIENTKECKICHKLLSADYEGDVCPHCQEEDLFMRVKDYIRSNVVNEYMVADHFPDFHKESEKLDQRGAYRICRKRYTDRRHQMPALWASRFLSNTLSGLYAPHELQQ